MKKCRTITIFCLSIVWGAILLTSCGPSKKDFEKIPHTAFIEHYEFNPDSEKPFNSYWLNLPKLEKINAKADPDKTPLYINIKPVTLDYLAESPDR